MKEFISNRAKHAVSKGDILAIAALAKADAAAGNKVINASIGAFLSEQKELVGVEAINSSLSSNVVSAREYPPIVGYPAYNTGVFNWVFKDKAEQVSKSFNVFTGATLGGTGACFIAFSIFADHSGYVLLPSIMWNNYKLVTQEAHTGHREYNFLNESEKLDLDSIRENIEKSFKESGKAFLLINDPCQNPTGYCMDEEEYQKLFAILNEEGKKAPLEVLFDIAYLDYFDVKGHHCGLVDEISKGALSFLPLIAFSCSKTFGLYGLRAGALICLAPDKETSQSIKEAFMTKARGTYSCPVGAALYSVAQTLNQEEKKIELAQQIKNNCIALGIRSRYYISLLQKYGISYLPYKSGFFITINVGNAGEVYDRLAEQHMYVVPLDETHIRLAVSGLSEDEGETLISHIKEADKKHV